MRVEWVHQSQHTGIGNQWTWIESSNG